MANEDKAPRETTQEGVPEQEARKEFGGCLQRGRFIQVSPERRKSVGAFFLS